MNSVTIPIGNGRVIIDSSVLKQVSRGKYVVLRAISESGPCKDGMCQVIRDIKVNFEEPFDDEHFHVFAGDGIFVAMEDPVYTAINKGRETVTVLRGLFGRTAVKGFVYTD